METKLERIAEISATTKKPEFTALYHRMCGFRPNKGCHDAIKATWSCINTGRIHYIVDADIKGFFDHIDHDWMMKFVSLYIKDPNILWLINSYLKVGVIDNKTYNATEEGTAQGNIISPILANIYMHNVLVLWYRFAIKENFKGANFLVVYADDFIAGFELESEAKQYYELLKERMNRFNLELEESKSRLIAFSKWICVDNERKGFMRTVQCLCMS